MSEDNNDQTGLARRDFLKTTGVVVVGFSLARRWRPRHRAMERLPCSAASCPARPIRDRSTPTSRSILTIRRGLDRLRRARSGRANRDAASCC